MLTTPQRVPPGRTCIASCLPGVPRGSPGPLRPSLARVPRTALPGPDPGLSAAVGSADGPLPAPAHPGLLGLLPHCSVPTALVFILTMLLTNFFTCLSLWTHADIY